jgi:protein-tyrosine-phosphatase
MTETTALPGTVLFACTHNMIRSPIAEGLMKSLFPNKVYVDSCGINAGALDGFLISVMEEVGIDMSGHTPKSFNDLQDEYFDLIICFSEESYEIAQKFAEAKVTEVEYWPVFDAALTSNIREERLRAYREVRKLISDKLHERFDIKTE